MIGPGDYALSLIVSTVDGDEVAHQNLRTEVRVSVRRTFGYTIRQAGAAVSGFVTSTAGVVTSAALIMTTAGGVWFARRPQRALGVRPKRQLRPAAMPRRQRR